MAEPNVANVIIGPAVIYAAVYGTAFPALTTKPTASSWVSPWTPLGYTESGVSLSESPATKDFTPDETITPIKKIVTGIGGEVKFTLWEATLENLSKALALASLANPGTGIKTLSVGSGNPIVEYALGIQGAGVGAADGRIITIFRAVSVSAVDQVYSRKDITKLACTFTMLADSTKASTQDVFQVVDFGAGS
jgi:hypothetical protein